MQKVHSYHQNFDAFDVSAFLTKHNGFLVANQSPGAHGHAGKQRSLDGPAAALDCEVLNLLFYQYCQ